MNPLLKRQLNKCNCNNDGFKNCCEQFELFISLVDESYNDFEEDKKLLERSIDISSREYAEQLEQIKSLQTTVIQNEKMAGIGLLSAGIAHEINNPLGFIKSNIETMTKYIDKMEGFHKIICSLLSSDEAEENKAILEKLAEYSKKNKINMVYEDLPELISETLDGVQRISKIVKSLLSFSRKLEINELEDYDLNKGITDTLTVAYNEIKYYASVEQEFGDIPIIKAKSGEINQVLLNIIMNAVYAVKEKKISGVIKIKTYSDNEYVCCEISDNGGGIPQELISRIFEPFFTTKPVGKGTGLGLSISYDIIVNKHKGRLDVKTEHDKGTVFTIYLPIDVTD